MPKLQSARKRRLQFRRDLPLQGMCMKLCKHMQTFILPFDHIDMQPRGGFYISLCVCNAQMNVEGPSCSRCKPGTFHLSPANKDGCLGCFCMGVTQQCFSSSLYRDVVRPADMHFTLWKPVKSWSPLRFLLSLILSFVLRSLLCFPLEMPMALHLWTGSAPTASATASRWRCPLTDRSSHSPTLTATARSLTSGSYPPATREIRYSLMVLVFKHHMPQVRSHQSATSQSSHFSWALPALLSWCCLELLSCSPSVLLMLPKDYFGLCEKQVPTAPF